MRYVRIKWKYDEPDDPVTLYSEIDDTRAEIRKVEVFRDSTIGYASIEGEAGGSVLGEGAMPDLEEIASDPQFQPSEITKEEFEKIWAGRKRQARHRAR